MEHELFVMCGKYEYLMLVFDKSLTTVSPKCQLDVSVRFWGSSFNCYLNSEILGVIRAADMLKDFINATKVLELCKFLQIPIDGPNVMKAVQWDIIYFLRAANNLFHKVCPYRADFCHYSDSTKFPLKFFEVRLFQNQNVAQHDIEIIPDITAFVE
ncbi:hypothetical protein PR048_023712 [Dryococelus australis]|uniref:Uncharacterized protein n=1 Tax=Dryococelus australis TaxID=614101 RepID=A0ABQ9GUX9_9NEOP|nr:hypothetical protein PR048_023712 [Dryococelus australis]